MLLVGFDNDGGGDRDTFDIILCVEFVCDVGIGVVGSVSIDNRRWAANVVDELFDDDNRDRDVFKVVDEESVDLTRDITFSSCL